MKKRESMEIVFKRLESVAVAIVERAKLVKVFDQESYNAANVIVGEIKVAAKNVDADRREFVDPLNMVVKKINGRAKPMADALATAEETVKGEMRAWLRAQEEKRLAAERKAQAEADAREKAEREKLERRAQKAEEKGDADKAEALRDQAAQVYVPAPFIPAAPKTIVGANGTASTAKKKIKVEIVDVAAFMRAVADGALPMNFLTVDLPAVNRWAAASGLKQGSTAIAGARVVEDFEISTRTGTRG